MDNRTIESKREVQDRKGLAVVSDSDRKPCSIDLLDGHSIAIGGGFGKEVSIERNYLFLLEYFYPLVLCFE